MSTFSHLLWEIFRGSTVVNHGQWNYSSTNELRVGGDLENYGSMVFTGSLQINTSGSLLSNGTEFSVGQDFTVNSDATIIGSFLVGGDMTNNSGGNLVLNDGILTIEGDYRNTGAVSAAGSSQCFQITVQGYSENLTSSNGFGTDGSLLDICDESPANAGAFGFDIDNTGVGPNVSNCACGNILPVELISFQANSINGYVELSWTTASEQNSKEFIIERGTAVNDFVRIGSKQASGSSNGLKHYRYSDQKAGTGRVYYRLKQVDFDGKSVYTVVFQKLGH